VTELSKLLSRWVSADLTNQGEFTVIHHHRPDENVLGAATRLDSAERFSVSGGMFEKFAAVCTDGVTASIKNPPDKQAFCDVLPFRVQKQVIRLRLNLLLFCQKVRFRQMLPTKMQNGK
jgi:hypothetical protein